VRRELLIAGAIGLLAVALGVGAIAVPGVLADPPEEVRESYLSLQQPYIGVTEAGGETVTLSLSSRLSHHGGTAENVTIEVRAIDAETGLVTTTEQQSLGSISGERDVPFRQNITVPREGGYRIETSVFADERRADRHSGTLSNLDSVMPDAAKSSVGFHEFAGASTPLDAISYRIASTDGETATLNVTAYLTNGGDDTTGGLDLRLRARQGDSNVIADSATVRIGEIRPSRTRTVSAELTVPDGYDYYLDGVLSADGVIVATESSVADLDPTETLRINETQTETGFSSDDFVEDSDDLDGEPRPREPQETAGQGGPGFTVVGAVVVFVLTGIVLGRRNR
jgi:hypothetical protein